MNTTNTEPKPVRDTINKRALLLYGGWDGHQPELFADFAEDFLLDNFEVVRSQDLDMLNPDTLASFDLLVPIWTFGEINENHEEALLNAIANGLGMVSWHGMASAFLGNRAHKFLLGGQFVAHPGGTEITYSVRFVGNDPMTTGLNDMIVTSEQYYLIIDPAVRVLAITVIEGGEMEWLKGVEMPVAWTRRWGKGGVFYCALGHTVDILKHPSVNTLLRRAISWATREVELELTGETSLD